jgi:hypothetical protein
MLLMISWDEGMVSALRVWKIGNYHFIKPSFTNGLKLIASLRKHHILRKSFKVCHYIFAGSYCQPLGFNVTRRIIHRGLSILGLNSKVAMIIDTFGHV